MQKVRKGVIVVAGLGTRFLPATKAMPKEMLPVLDKPVLQFIVEEMAGSGITEIMFVTSSQKRAIEDHFDRDRNFEEYIEKKGKSELLKPLTELSQKVRFFYTRQSEPLGNGHALLCAKEFVGSEPFAFSDGDSIIDAKTPVIAQLLRVFRQEEAPVIGVQRLSDTKQMTLYGNIYGKKTGRSKTYRVTDVKEKPSEKDVSPEGLIVGGMRYILTKDVWPYLETAKVSHGGEIWLTDAVHALAKKKKLLAYEYEGQYFDTGNKLALLKTAVHFAMKDVHMRSVITQFVAQYE